MSRPGEAAAEAVAEEEAAPPESASAPPRARRYRLFEVVGLELEYPVVGPDLAVLHLVEDAFRRIAGRPTSDVELAGAGFSNELADHVFELKTPVPEASLVRAEAVLAGGVRAFNRVLADGWGARLLPTGMHPLMHPGEGRLWCRSGSAIYAAYDRVFGIRGHGWLNVQSCHVNLPLGESDEEAVLVHDAVCLLLPYLPALTASSPLVEGAPGPAVDNRLAFYRGNQARVPRIAGDVVPEYMESPAAYRRDVLGGIYRELRSIPEAVRLRHEWVNSRGAIVRFSRRAVEIRVLDTQECPKMDVAVAAFLRGALAHLVERLGSGDLERPDHRVLVEDYERVVAEGRAARVAAPHLRDAEGRGRPPATAAEALSALLAPARRRLAAAERPYLDLVARRLAHGNLSERILAALGDRRSDPGAIRDLYTTLADHLDADRPWWG